MKSGPASSKKSTLAQPVFISMNSVTNQTFLKLLSGFQEVQSTSENIDPINAEWKLVSEFY